MEVRGVCLSPLVSPGRHSHNFSTSSGPSVNNLCAEYKPYCVFIRMSEMLTSMMTARRRAGPEIIVIIGAGRLMIQNNNAAFHAGCRPRVGLPPLARGLDDLVLSTTVHSLTSPEFALGRLGFAFHRTC